YATLGCEQPAYAHARRYARIDDLQARALHQGLFPGLASSLAAPRALKRLMHLLVHGNRHATESHGHMLASPRMYDFTVEVFFLGRRRASYQALVVAAGIRPGQRVLDVGC